MLTAVLAAPETGKEITQKSQTAQFAFKTLRVSGEMTLTRGTESIGQRSFTLDLLEQDATSAFDKARVLISAPTALKDTELLSWSSGAGENQQWLVTPRTHRVQRIADRGRQAAFVSSDFSYEDILKWQVDDYDYGAVSRGPCPAGTCTVVEAKPRIKYSSYTLVKVYYDDMLRVSQIEYFGSDPAKPRKTLVHSGYVLQARSPQPSRSVMTNHETETSTQILWSGYQMDIPLDERIMSPTAISR